LTLSLTERINEDMKTAMKAKDKLRTGVLRMLLSEFKYAMTTDQKATTLDDEQAAKVLKAYSKQLKKSLDAYPESEKEKRQTISQELEIVDSYLSKETAPTA